MRKRTVVYGLAAIMILSLLTPSFAQGPVLRHAPVNPAFVQYLTNLKAGMATMQSDFGKRLGYVPSPHGPYKKGTKAAYMAPPLHMPAPSRFDLRETGRITPVRDQMDCGSCWAFGTYGSLESYLLTGENWDLSERNLNNTHGFDIPPCEGGQSWMSTAYLSRWSGPIDEADDPYDIPPDNYLDFNSPPELQPVKHFQEVIWFPERDDWTQIDDLKEEIMANGALYIAFGIYVDYYNFDTAAYYCDNPALYANHAVTVAGWDDDYPVGNFNTQPLGPGAFIIKNSWGDFGDNGYIYISYYDTTLTEPVAFHSAESTNNYTHQYSYDPLGWVYDFGYEPAAKGYLNAGVIDTAWFANVFTVESFDPLGAVSFYVPAPYAGHPPYDYEVYIYDDVGAEPTSGNLRSVKTGSFDFSGYYTVRLNEPVRVFGPRFSVVVKLTTPDYGYPIGVEGPCCWWGDYSTTATANPGESFLSPDGSDWEDLTSTEDCEECNVCLKAFTVKPQENYEKAPSLSIKPLAQTHINQAKEFAKQAEDLLSQAKAKDLETSVCEKPLNEANDLIAKAKTMMTNPVYANNLALEAMKKLKQAMDCLLTLLSR